MATSTKPVTLITSRDPQGVRIMDLIAVPVNKAKLTSGEDGSAQCLIMNGGELQSGVAELIRRLSTPNQFANEQVASNYSYPKEYRGPKPIVEQIKMLVDIFGLDPSHALEFAKNLPELPDGAEGWFAIPTIDAIASKFFPEVIDPAERYCKAVDLVLEKLGKSRTFHNYRAGEIIPNRHRQHARTVTALEQIAHGQKGGILIIAAQFGVRHRGKSVRRARETFRADEFGLGAFAIGCMALTHSERYVRWEQLHTDGPGDEFSQVAGSQFGFAPSFRWSDSGLKLDMYLFNLASDNDGSVSAFVPQ